MVANLTLDGRGVAYMAGSEMTRRDAFKALAGAAAASLSAASVSAQDGRATVEPVETDELFANPHCGWQTFHRFADEDECLAGLPSSCAYYRFYWSQTEQKRGQVNFDLLDSLLERAEVAGQKLAFRVMCAGTNTEYMYVPQWLKDNGCPGFEYRYGEDATLHWVPDMNSPGFQDEHFRLIDALGERYDGDPRLDIVDIGSVGLWGEWHMSGTNVDVPSPEARLAIIDRWRDAFPKTPKVMLIGNDEGMKRAAATGCGWRADCLGDMGGFSKTWNHMEHFYRQAIERAEAGEAWRVAPVAFESCWDMRKWQEEGWDIRAIFDYALDLHVSYENNKSAPLPEGTRDEVERFIRKMGYRLVPRTITHSANVPIGRPVSVSIAWENVGVAPPYWDYLVAARLVPETGGKPAVAVSKSSIKGWLPQGPVATDMEAGTDGLKPGMHVLQIALVAPGTEEPAVRMAIGGRGEDGWYSTGRVELTA